MRFLLPLWIVLTLSPALADAPPHGVLYVHPDNLLSVRFPGKPTETTPEAPDHDHKIRIKTATLLDGEHGYTVSTTVYPVPPGMSAPAPIAPGAPMPASAVAAIKTAIDQTIDNVMVSSKGHVLARKAITVDGLLGSEVQFEALGPDRAPYRATGRVFVSPVPLTTYLAITIQYDGKPDPAARRFLDSLHLGQKVEIQP